MEPHSDIQYFILKAVFALIVLIECGNTSPYLKGIRALFDEVFNQKSYSNRKLFIVPTT